MTSATSWAGGLGHSSERLQVYSRLTSACLFGVAGLSLLTLTILSLAAPQLVFGSDWHGARANWSNLGVASALYLASHAVRAVRLMILAGSYRTSLRRLACVHLFASGVSAITPFKLGELYRIAEVGAAVGKLSNATLTVWIERTFDVAAVCFLVGVGSLTSPTFLLFVTPLLSVSLAFVCLTIITFVFGPQNVETLSLFVIRRYHRDWTIVPLRLMEMMRGFIAGWPQILSGKFLSVTMATIAIWSLEVVTVCAIVPDIRRDLLEAIRVLTFGLSGVLRTSAAAAPAAGQTALISGVSVESLLQYRLVVCVPILIVGVVAGLSLVRARLYDVLGHRDHFDRARALS